MYCPKCGTDNLENASFCRKCGTDIRLVPQAITGTLPVVHTDADEDAPDDSRRHRRRGKKRSTVEGGIKNIFMGIGFIFVALAVSRFMPGGQVWWFWMLIPAFAMLGGGVAELLNAKRSETKPMMPAQPVREVQAAPPASALPPLNTSELVQPPSVTERTTQLLGREVQARQTGASPENQGQNS